jgi:hypothetical protein
MNRSVVGTAAVAVALGAAAGCGRSGLSMQETDAATQDFRQRYERKEFGQLYERAAPELRAGASEALFVSWMRSLSQKLGPWQSAQPLGSSKLPGDDDRVVFLFRSRFSNGEATERFVWRSQGGKPILVGYHINSRELGL